MIDWLVLMVVGRILIYLWQQFPLPSSLTKFESVNKLHTCDLCAGVHIYALMSWVMGLHFFGYMPVVSEYITGGVVSFAVHIFLIGWREKFTETMVV